MSQIEEERQRDDDERQLDLGDEPALSTEDDRGAVVSRPSDASSRSSDASDSHAGSPASAHVEREQSMLPGRRERPPLESAFVRAIATAGVVGIGVALAAILVSQNVAGWIVGLAVSLLSVTLSAILWSSRRL